MNCAIPTPLFCRGNGHLGDATDATTDIPRTYNTTEISVWQEESAAEDFTSGPGLFGGRYGFGGIRREGIGGRGGWAVEGEILGFVVLDSAEESIVVGGALSGDLSQEKIDVARGGDGRAFRGILGGEGSIVALDGRAGGSLYAGAGRKMQGHVRFNVEWGAKLDGRRGAAGRWFCGRIGQANLRQQRGDMHGLLGPIDEFGHGDFVIESERLARGGRVGCGDAGHLSTEPIGDGEKLGEVLPFFFRRLVKRDAKK